MLLLRSVSAPPRDGKGALTEERRHGCRSDEAVQQERSWRRSDGRPRNIPRRRRDRAQHHSRDACDANFQARTMTASSARLLATLGLGARRDAEKALTEERRHGCRSDEAAQQERSWRRSDERLLGITSRAEALR
jgi:hypothetical protein